jgi:hypothetical protein
LSQIRAIQHGDALLFLGCNDFAEGLTSHQ